MIKQTVPCWRPIPKRVLSVGSFSIRRPEAKDAPALAQLSEDSWMSGVEGILPDRIAHRISLAERTQLWEDLLGEAGHLLHLVAHSDLSAGPVGILSFGRPRFPPLNRWRFEIYLLGVARTRQRSGVGRALVTGAFAHMALLGGIGCCVRAFEDAAPARRFYLSLGAQLIDSSPSLIDGLLTRNVLYGWDDLQGTLTNLSGDNETAKQLLDTFTAPPETVPARGTFSHVVEEDTPQRPIETEILPTDSDDLTQLLAMVGDEASPAQPGA